MSPGYTEPQTHGLAGLETKENPWSKNNCGAQGQKRQRYQCTVRPKEEWIPISCLTGTNSIKLSAANQPKTSQAKRLSGWTPKSNRPTESFRGFSMRIKRERSSSRSYRSGHGSWMQSPRRCAARKTCSRSWPTSRRKKLTSRRRSKSSQLLSLTISSTCPLRTNRSGCGWFWTRWWSKTGASTCTTKSRYPGP